jgi:hypothetical protein
MDGEVFKKGKGIKMLFWEDTITPEVKLTFFTKRGFVWVANTMTLKGDLLKNHLLHLSMVTMEPR